MQIFKEDAFTSIITDAHCQKYHDIIARNFINSVHNYIEFGIEERAIKIQEYAQKGHILYQMTKAENLEKILTSKKESYAPLIEIQSNKDLYENNKINPREILKLIYKDEVEK